MATGLVICNRDGPVLAERPDRALGEPPHRFLVFAGKEYHLPALSRLTPRQVEIFPLLLCGYSDKELASRLSVSVYTIRIHVEKVAKKLVPASHERPRRLLMAWWTKILAGESPEVPPPSKAEDGRMIYFIYAPDVRRVKVGFSVDPIFRLETLLSCSPVHLKLLGYLPGTMRLEADLHLEFATRRLHGEWFNADETVMERVYQLLSQPEAVDMTERARSD